MTSRLLLLALTVPALAAPPEPKFKHVTIDPAIQIGYGVAVADVDGDKAPDVLLADKKQFVWYRNPGAAEVGDAAAWTKHILAENLTEKDNVCIAAQDLDGDGKCEVAVGGEWNPGDTEKSGAVFYLIAPADRTQRWEAVKFPAVEPTTHRMKWIRLEAGVEGPGSQVSGSTAKPETGNPKPETWGLVVVPLHGRGNKNGEGAPVKVLCYRKPADVRGEWKAEIVDESMHMTHNFDIIPDATRPSLVIAGREGMRHVSRQGDGWKADTDHFPQRSFTPDSKGAGEIRRGATVARLPAPPFYSAIEVPKPKRKQGEFFCTIEPMHGTSLVAYVTVEGRQGVRQFLHPVLTDQLADGHALACGDVLGAGSDQIVVGWRGNPQKPRPVGIKLFTPLDDTGDQWRESFIDDNEMACEDLVLADLNADGKLDVVASGRATKNLKIYLNETGR
ncbi:MAG: VCBS repeat-containing protein [Chthoniobacteraceae bacterium]